MLYPMIIFEMCIDVIMPIGQDLISQLYLIVHWYCCAMLGLDVGNQQLFDLNICALEIGYLPLPPVCWSVSPPV